MSKSIERLQTFQWGQRAVMAKASFHSTSSDDVREISLLECPFFHFTAKRLILTRK